MTDQRRTPHWRSVHSSTHEILNVRSEIARRQSRAAALVEEIGRALAHPVFFIVLFAGHLLWVALNLPIYPWFAPWDPYPFAFLATVASAEAPFIALLVLMYQRRGDRISELREETHLQVTLHQERQVTLALRLLSEIQAQLDIASREDPELLDQLRQEMDPQQLMHDLREQLKREEDDAPATAP